MCVCPDVSFEDFAMKHLPSCIMSTRRFLSTADMTACSFQGEKSTSSSYCNVSTLPSSKQCENEEWEQVVQNSKKMKQLVRAQQEIPIFNRFDLLTVEDDGLKVSISGSVDPEENKENLQGHSPKIFKGKREVRGEICDSDIFVRKKAKGEKRSSRLEAIDGIFPEVPFTLVQKKQNRRSHRRKKSREPISFVEFKHENRYSLLERHTQNG